MLRGQTPGKNRAQVSPTPDPCPLQIEPLLPFLAGGTPGTGGEGLSAEWGERPGDLGRGRGGQGPREGAEGEGMRGRRRRERGPGARRRRAARDRELRRWVGRAEGRGGRRGAGRRGRRGRCRGRRGRGGAGGGGAGRLGSLEAGSVLVGATAATPGVAGVCECSPSTQRGRPCSLRRPRLRLVPRSGRPAVRREPDIAARPQVTVRLQGISHLRSFTLVRSSASIRAPRSPPRLSPRVSLCRRCPRARPWWTCWAGGSW